MQVARIQRPGGPEVIDVVEAPTPAVGPTDVLVAVEASSVNHTDVWVRRGATDAELPMTPGLDAAGTVEEVGDRVSRVAKGDRVVLYGVVHCGECRYCEAGDAPLCREYGAVGESRDGAHAEYVAVPADNVIRLPDAVSFRDAAAAQTSYATAWRALFERANLSVGETVVVLGASGGVGTAAVQLANLAGARTVACTSSSWKADRLADLGADHVVDYTEARLADAVRESGVDHVDAVLDSVGGDVYEQAIRCLSRDGRLVTLGATQGDADAGMLRHVFWRQLTVVGSTGYSRADLRAVVERLADGAVEPVVDREVGLDGVPAAHEALEARDVFGKIVVRP